jgi:hypothetical protein
MQIFSLSLGQMSDFAVRSGWSTLVVMPRGTSRAHWMVAAVFAVACGGAPPPPEEPAPADPSLSTDEVEQPELSDQPSGGGSEEKSEGGESKPAEPAKEPEFKEGGSVQDAMNAIPQGTARINLDQETLGQPIANPSVYESCKLAPSQKFKLKIAIWDGKAVGVDVETQPPNKRAAECIDKIVRGITWKDKVKSLNTVEFSF